MHGHVHRERAFEAPRDLYARPNEKGGFRAALLVDLRLMSPHLCVLLPRLQQP
jgi:hypothetical protein